MGAQFLHLSCQKGGSHPCTPVSHTTVVDLCSILSLYKNGITRIQSYKIEFVARACNIQCILHQSCPMITLKLYTDKKFSCLTNITAPSEGLGPIIGCSALFIGPRNTCCGPCLLRRLRGIKHRLLYQISGTLIIYLMLTRQ